MKYILQHIGPASQKDISEKVSKKEIEDLLNCGLIKLAGGDEEIGLVINSSGEKHGISNRRINEIFAERYIYAQKYNDPEAHLFKGVHFGQNISTINHLLSANDKNELIKLFPDGNLKFWGTENGDNNRTKRKFKKIMKDDRLILIGSDNVVEAIGSVAYPLENKDIGRVLWNNGRYENILFLTGVKIYPNKNAKEIKNILELSQDYNRISLHIINDTDDFERYHRLDREVRELFDSK